MNDFASYVRSTENARTVGHFLGTPVVVKGLTWLPATEIATWMIMTVAARRKRPERSWGENFGVGALTTLVTLGSEWCHNLAHAAVARWVGRPVDAIRVTFGMPLLIYHHPEDPSITPRQHLIRSLGGPAFNGIALIFASLLRSFTRPETAAREVADAAVGMNTFLSTGSLVPNPEIDGGPVLKWSLIAAGMPPEKVPGTVNKVKKAVGGGLAGAAAVALARRRYFLGVILALLAWISLGFDLRKEDSV